MKKALILGLLLINSCIVFSQAWKTYPSFPSGSLISFPVDEGRHSSEPVEWWYTSGHLTGNSTGNHYSYMLTYFYYPRLGLDGFRILTLSNDDTGVFFDETAAVNYNVLSADSLNIEANIIQGGIESWHNKTDSNGNSLPFEYVISASSDHGSLNLEYNALKPPLIIADKGFLNQGNDAYSYYYAQTKNEVSGTISFNGISETVTGTSWIDRQYGTFNPSIGEDYEWFSIQLSNGMDILAYNIFTSNNEIPDISTYRILSLYVDEETQHTTSDIEIERLEYSFMPDKQMCYSQKWRLTSALKNIDIVISTLNSNNEIQLPFRFYEGATTVVGTVNGINVTGVGFAELLHSYETPDITIINNELWDMNKPLTWLNNKPDEGNPLKYDLEYSVDNQQSFSPIISQLSETSYNWGTAPLSKGDECWVKVTGYSADKTLINTDIKKLVVNNDGLIEETLSPESSNTIYPNPSTGRFTIEGENIKKIEVIEISGKTIYSSSQIKSEHAIDLSVSPKGVYFVKITTGKGTTATKLILY
ncbi:MAG: lipocalin-like domain-containing protein [Bacteroidota bacterium]